VLAALLVVRAGAGGPFQLWAIVALFAGAWGGTAPDWLEVAWWRSRGQRGAQRLWIKHRTLTHWGVPWVLLLCGSYISLGSAWWAPAAFGFAAGGVMHLLADWPNPMGVPWLFRRHSLAMWTSGSFEVLIIVLSWAACALLADGMLFGGQHTGNMFRALSTLI
jgi:membrane-bound metal-dependent hydrolase YbcI (DUF457 family)